MDIARVHHDNTLTILEKQRIKHKTWRSILQHRLKSSSLAQESASKKRFCRLSIEEIKQWELSLERLLSHTYGQAAFKIFLQSEFCEENIEFWLACEEFRKIKSPAKLASKASRIYEEFIRSESPKEINLDYHTKDSITQNLQQPTYSCFAGAQNKIYCLMENSSYPRFIQSEFYKDLCKVAARKGTYLKA
ncbi:regulator of G-protein signaling 2-like [Anguilla anguilla]|uniref:RGS domain-containing protein n=1 Tax=Anguilla anguilla TaxID=7936 RepID=A0A9D3MEC7_ANGAN|nr:regulator of G-protein signaling 2-like [Anguilla anguilla]KAG5847427.1 hypothetical protein ANANG_G00125930 [Anguilla anguilla]